MDKRELKESCAAIRRLVAMKMITRNMGRQWRRMLIQSKLRREGHETIVRAILSPAQADEWLVREIERMKNRQGA